MLNTQRQKEKKNHSRTKAEERAYYPSMKRNNYSKKKVKRVEENIKQMKLL